MFFSLSISDPYQSIGAPGTLVHDDLSQFSGLHHTVGELAMSLCLDLIVDYVCLFCSWQCLKAVSVFLGAVSPHAIETLGFATATKWGTFTTREPLHPLTPHSHQPDFSTRTDPKYKKFWQIVLRLGDGASCVNLVLKTWQTASFLRLPKFLDDRCYLFCTVSGPEHQFSNCRNCRPQA